MRSKFAAIVICIIMGLSPLFSQTSNTVDSVGLESGGDNFLIFNLMYNTNNAAERIDQEVNTSVTLGDISFFHKSGLWASFMPAFYSNASEPSRDIDGALGYSYYFDNGFDINGYYQYHHYQGDSVFMGIDYQHLADFSIGYSNGGFYGNIDYYGLFGTEPYYFGNMTLGYYSSWIGGKNNNIGFSIFPMVLAGFGNDKWLFQQLSAEETNLLIADLEQAGYTSGSFDFQSFNIMLPLNLNLGGFTVGFSYLYSILAEKYKFVGMNNQSSLLVSTGYVFTF